MAGDGARLRCISLEAGMLRRTTFYASSAYFRDFPLSGFLYTGVAGCFRAGGVLALFQGNPTEIHAPACDIIIATAPVFQIPGRLKSVLCFVRAIISVVDWSSGVESGCQY